MMNTPNTPMNRVARFLDLEFLINTVSERATSYRIANDYEAALKAQRFAALLHHTQTQLADEMTEEECAEAERLMGGEDH